MFGLLEFLCGKFSTWALQFLMATKKDYEEILEFLQKGHRLTKPPMCPEYIYYLMLDCWHENHLCRMTFKQLKSQLETFDPERQTRPVVPNPFQQKNLTYIELLNADD